ncbi:MAG: hypothetical protein WDW38_000597 [Sanguina aurantia]
MPVGRGLHRRHSPTYRSPQLPHSVCDEEEEAHAAMWGHQFENSSSRQQQQQQQQPHHHQSRTRGYEHHPNTDGFSREPSPHPMDAASHPNSLLHPTHISGPAPQLAVGHKRAMPAFLKNQQPAAKHPNSKQPSPPPTHRTGPLANSSTVYTHTTTPQPPPRPQQRAQLCSSAGTHQQPASYAQEDVFDLTQSPTGPNSGLRHHTGTPQPPSATCHSNDASPCAFAGSHQAPAAPPTSSAFKTPPNQPGGHSHPQQATSPMASAAASAAAAAAAAAAAPAPNNTAPPSHERAAQSAQISSESILQLLQECGPMSGPALARMLCVNGSLQPDIDLQDRLTTFHVM